VKIKSKIALVFLTVLLSSPVALLFALGYSETLLKNTVARLPKSAGAVERLHIEDVKGSLAGGFSVGLIIIEHDLVHLRIEGLRARIDLLPLLWQTIDVEEFAVDSLYVAPQPRNRPPPIKPAPFLPRLLTLEARQTYIKQATIAPEYGAPLVLAELTAHGTILEKRIRIREARGQLGALNIEADGELRAAIPLGLSADARVTFTPASGPRWVLEAKATGDLAELDLQGGLLEPFTAKLNAAQLRALPPWNLTAEAAISELDITRFGGSDLLGEISGSLQLDLDANDYRARGRLNPQALAAGFFEIDFLGRFAHGVLSTRALQIDHKPSGLNAVLNGTFSFSDARPFIDIAGTWKRFRWPLQGTSVQVQSTAGEFSLLGQDDYALTAAGDFLLGTLPTANGRVVGTLQPERLIITDSEIKALRGSSRLSGEVRWKPQLSWALRGRANNIDPSALQPTLTGALNLELEMSGRGQGRESSIDLNIRQLSGRLRETAASGSGKVGIRGDQYSFEKLALRFGGFDLALDGVLSNRRRDLDFRIKANDLAVIAPQARGRLEAQGVLRGTAETQRVRLIARGSDIELSELSAKRFVADIDIDPAGPADAPAAMLLELQELRALGREIERLRFDMTGQSREHRLTLNIIERDFSLRAAGVGNLSKRDWQQRWEQAEVDLPANIALVAIDPLLVTLTTSTAYLSPFCLSGRDSNGITGAATLCSSAAFSDGAWNARIDIAALPIASLLPRPSNKVNYDGSISMTASLGASAGGPLLGVMRADFRDAALSWIRGSGKRESVPFGSGYVDFESSSDRLLANLEISAGSGGKARGRLQADRETSDWRQMPLRANLRADSSALTFLYLFIPEIDRSAGDLALDFVIGGTLGTPLFNGVLRLENGELDFYQINLGLRKIAAEARLLDNTLVLRAKADVGGGSIAADADLAWRSALPYGSLKISGVNIPIIDLPEARITATPDLTFKVNGRELFATGSVNIPTARLMPVDLTGAITSSSDEIIVGDAAIDPQSSFQVSSDIRLSLGDRVTVDSFGLSGRVKGEINVRSTADGVTRGSGELSVTEGKYAALGRRLDIERGRLIFSGGFINDPGIDIRATKEFPDVKAGVNVRGTLREPRMSFFSEPSLPQSQVVSLILAGGTIEGNQGGDSSNASRDALLAQGGAILAQQLGQRIGIEDVGIEQNLANETSLVFGKYLSSRLYVSYGISLAEALNTLKIRYSINDRWTLRTEAGKEVSAELVYTVEKP